MIVTWYGQSCFRIQTRWQDRELVLFLDPFSREIGLRPPQGRADIVLVSHGHYDHNNVSSLKENPFLIAGPGEYEIKGIEIRGIPAFHDKREGKDRGMVTIFRLKIEEMTIVHLGDLGQAELSSEQLEGLGQADILMVPVGGIYTIDGEESVKIINQIEPKMAIPMHYRIPGLKIKLDPLEKFLKSMGTGEKQSQEKLVLRLKDLPQKEETEIFVMKPV